MTLVVGILAEGTVWMAGDRMVSDDTTSGHTMVKEPKVWQNGDLLVGSSGSIRSGQLIRTHQGPVQAEVVADPLDYLVTSVVPDWRSLLKKHKVKLDDAELIVSIKGRVFIIDEEWQVYEPADGTATIGHGSREGLIALDMTSGYSNPLRRLRKVFKAVSHRVMGISSDFDYLTS